MCFNITDCIEIIQVAVFIMSRSQQSESQQSERYVYVVFHDNADTFSNIWQSHLFRRCWVYIKLGVWFKPYRSEVDVHSMAPNALKTLTVSILTFFLINSSSTMEDKIIDDFKGMKILVIDASGWCVNAAAADSDYTDNDDDDVSILLTSTWSCFP